MASTGRLNCISDVNPTPRGAMQVANSAKRGIHNWIMVNNKANSKNTSSVTIGTVAKKHNKLRGCTMPMGRFHTLRTVNEEDDEYGCDEQVDNEDNTV